MAKKFTLEKVLYFAQKEDERGFQVRNSEYRVTGWTDLANIVTSAVGKGFIHEKTKSNSATYYGITDKGKMRLLFAKMMFNVSKDHPLDDLTKEVMAIAPLVLEQAGFTYPKFQEAIARAHNSELDPNGTDKKLMKLLNQFDILVPAKPKSKIKKLRNEFADFGRIITAYGPEMKESLGDRAKGLFKRFVGGSDDKPKETLTFDDAPSQTAQEKPAKESVPVSKQSAASQSHVSPPTVAEPMDEARALKTLNAMFKDDTVFDDFHDDKLSVPDGEPIKRLVDAGLAKVAAEDDGATYYELTPKGSDFALRVEKELLQSAGLPSDHIKPMLGANGSDSVNTATLELNGITAEASTKFDPNMSLGDYAKMGDELMRKVIPSAAADMVNDLHWDGAHDEGLSLYDAVKDIVDGVDMLMERANRASMVQPDSLRETAMKLHKEFLGNLTPEQLKGALFMEVYKTTGQKISASQMDMAVDNPAPEKPEIEPMRKRA